MTFSPPPLLHRFFRTIATIFSGARLWWHAAAIGLTYVIVMTGFDWEYFTFFRNTSVYRWLFSAVVIGGLLPLIGPLVLLLVAKLRKNAVQINTAWALGQAAILGWLISSSYKAFTGRIPPPRLFDAATSLDVSHGFQLGLLRGGIFWGWPSSHTTVAFAMAVTLIQLYPKHKGVLFGALLYAFYIGLGISMSIHWFSEFVAGALIGTVIGLTVGTAFKARLRTR